MHAAKFLGPVLLAALCGMMPARAATPSFDCTKAKSSAEMLVCADDELAKLDREVARLFTLAHNSPRIGSRRAELVGTQGGWIKLRDSCWKEPEVRACLYSTYVIRIHELREGYGEARRPDPSAISSGPMLVSCANFTSSIRATFVRLLTPMVYMTSGSNYRLVMMLAPAASGARYVAPYQGGEAVFWEKGGGATLQLPGRTPLNCRVRNAS
jgi:uncharacterized protein